MSLFWSQEQPRFFNEELVNWLWRDWSVEAIRIPIGIPNAAAAQNWKGEKERVRAVVNSCVENGLYAIVDWHSHHPFTREAVNCLGELADEFGDCPNVIYEPWNEPAVAYDWTADIRPHHLEVIGRIRQAAPSALIIAGTPNFCQSFSDVVLDPLDLPNVSYALHFYAGTHRHGLRQKARVALDAGLSLFVSEWGLGEADGDGQIDIEETMRWMRFLDDNQISSMNWAISDKQEACATLRPTAGSHGKWRKRDLTRAGRILRHLLRSYRSA